MKIHAGSTNMIHSPMYGKPHWAGDDWEPEFPPKKYGPRIYNDPFGPTVYSFHWGNWVYSVWFGQ